MRILSSIMLATVLHGKPAAGFAPGVAAGRLAIRSSAAVSDPERPPQQHARMSQPRAANGNEGAEDGGGSFITIEAIDLSTCPSAAAAVVAETFVRGFYRPAAPLAPGAVAASDAALQPLIEEKAERLRGYHVDEGTEASLRAAAAVLPATVFVARDDTASGAVLGCGSLEVCVAEEGLLMSGGAARAHIAKPGYEERKGSRKPVLFDLAVLPEARRRGAARALCERIEAEARSLGFDQVGRASEMRERLSLHSIGC